MDDEYLVEVFESDGYLLCSKGELFYDLLEAYSQGISQYIRYGFLTVTDGYEPNIILQEKDMARETDYYQDDLIGQLIPSYSLYDLYVHYNNYSADRIIIPVKRNEQSLSLLIIDKESPFFTYAWN